MFAHGTYETVTVHGVAPVVLRTAVQWFSFKAQHCQVTVVGLWLRNTRALVFSFQVREIRKLSQLGDSYLWLDIRITWSKLFKILAPGPHPQPIQGESVQGAVQALVF